METAYGHEGGAPTPDEIERYVLWSARMRRLMRSNRVRDGRASDD
jgi:hypothetical protein